MSQSKDYGSTQSNPLLYPYIWSCVCGGHSRKGFGYKYEAYSDAAEHKKCCNLEGFFTTVTTIWI